MNLQILGLLPSPLARMFRTRAPLANRTEATARRSRPRSKHTWVYVFPQSLSGGLKGGWKWERVRGFLLAAGSRVCCCSDPQTASSADLFDSALRLNTAVTSPANRTSCHRWSSAPDMSELVMKPPSPPATPPAHLSHRAAAAAPSLFCFPT